jgi:hypothetical protein
MYMVRKYQGPLQPGKRSAYVRGLNQTEKKQTKAIVKRAINSTLETKSHYHPRTTDYEVTTSSPFLIDFLNIPQGTTDGDRQGDEILYKHLKINLFLRGAVNGAVKTGTALDHVRVLLFRWNEPDYVGGVFNSPSTLSLFGTNFPLGTNLFTAMVNHEENGRSFTMIADKKVKLAGDIENMTNCDSPERKTAFMTFNVNAKKYGCKKVKYDSINPANNSHMKGIYLMVLTDNQGGALTSGPTVSVDSRLLFKDA